MTTNRLMELNLTPKQMEDNAPSFMEKIIVLAADVGLDLIPFQADHIALRINNERLAKEAHCAWLERGKEISTAMINGRPIVIIEFTHPIKLGHWQIECLELPYPAAGKSYPVQGWEHIEFVIPSKADTAEEYLIDLKICYPELAEKWQNLEQCGVSTKLSSPKGEGERLANPTVAFKRDGVCIKLHPHSLKTIVRSEQS